ncbi:MAG: YihA family ribosome biogenesis GTP-binding protein [Desulfuromonadales bacterium]|nr:YihA family ribosome biogenesis GTP-binding protein [Desulfuromonadales bacterium]
MHVKTAIYMTSATKPANYPAETFPEIAFAGRSNVGKSSMINKLLNRKSLVRTSSTPGRTQMLNFFNINEEFLLVDLPGYGFAKVPLSVKKAWGPMIRTYLQERKSLAAVVMLYDIRRTPRSEDIQLLDWLEEFGVPTIPVITKIDKVNRSQRQKHLKEIAEVTGIDPGAFTLFSALSREGFDDLWERLEVALNDRVETEPLPEPPLFD